MQAANSNLRLRLLHPNILPFDTHGVAPRGLEGRKANRSARTNIKAGAMTRTLDLATVDNRTLYKGATVVRAYIFNRIDLAVQVEQRHPYHIELNQLRSAGWDFV